MTTKAKKYTLSSPLSGEQIGNIDEMLDDLYKRVSFALSSTTAHMGAFGEGDLLYFDGTGVESITAAATGNALISGGLLTEPSWGKIGLTTHVSGTLAVGNGGTGLSTLAQGDLLYASAANTLAALAKNTSATRYLSNTGASNNPAWAQVALGTGVSGTLPVGNGGTGSTAFTAGSVVFSNGTILTQDNANLFWDDTNNRLGIGTVSPARKVDVFIGADGGEGLRASNNTTPPFTHSAGLGVDNLGPLYGASLYVDGVARFSVNSNGGAVIGSTFLASFDGPANGLIVEGNVGIGTSTAASTVDIRRTDNSANVLRIVNANGGAGQRYILTSGAVRNWLVAAQQNINNGFEIGVSSAAGNETFEPLLGLAPYNVTIGRNLGTSSFPGGGTNGLVFLDGTALSSMGSNTAGLYANDVGGTVTMFGINEAGVTGALAMNAAALTAGSVLFAGSTGLVTQDNTNLFWDDTNNRLGVGTTVPLAKFHINVPATAPAASLVGGGLAQLNVSNTNLQIFNIVTDDTADAGVDAAFSFVRARGTLTTPTAPSSGDGVGRFSFQVFDGTVRRATGVISALVDGAVSSGVAPLRLVFGTGSTSAFVEAMRINSQQNVFIGNAETYPTAGTKALIFGDGTAPSGMGTNTAGLYADDVSGTVKMHGIHEDGITGVLGLVQTKTDTGDPTGSEGLFCINTFDNTFKAYADGAWRTLASGW